jgi:hypothetical protein
MGPIPDLANPPRVDAKMLNKVGSESGMNHRHIVGDPKCRRLQRLHHTGIEARSRSCFIDSAAVEIVNHDTHSGSPPGKTGAEDTHRRGQ